MWYICVFGIHAGLGWVKILVTVENNEEPLERETLVIIEIKRKPHIEKVTNTL